MSSVSSGPKAGGSTTQMQLKKQRTQRMRMKVHPEGEEEPSASR